jgi:hypothetical protein
MNTKIGMPWTYWENGFWAVVGFFAVCVLIFIGFCGIIAGEEHSGNLIAGIIFWLVAGLLLQALPHTENGIQFVPLPPWYYASWTAWIISIACWIALIIGWHANFSSVRADRVSAIVAIFIALGLNASLSFCSSSGVAEPKMENVACQDKIAQWEETKQQQSSLFTQLSNDKHILEARIKNLGIKNKRELMDHPVGGSLVEELEQLTLQTANLQKEIYSIELVQSKMRSLERQIALRKVSLSPEELSATIKGIEEQRLGMSGDQTPDSAVQRDKLLNGLIAQP